MAMPMRHRHFFSIMASFMKMAILDQGDYSASWYHGVFAKTVLLHFFGGKWYGGRLGGSPPLSVLDFAFGVYAFFFVHVGCSDCNIPPHSYSGWYASAGRSIIASAGGGHTMPRPAEA